MPLRSSAVSIDDVIVRSCARSSNTPPRREACEREYDLCMTQRKLRLTVTVDPELVEAGNRAVAKGSAGSLSAWVSQALTDRVRRDQQLALLGDAIADYEAKFGEISAEEIERQRRADRQSAVVVRGAPKRATRSKSA